MKLCKVFIKDFQQFKNLELDFTYPKGHEKAGEPLDKVCLIGSNGTGKTTILDMLSKALSRKNWNGIVRFQLENNGTIYYLITSNLMIEDRDNSLLDLFKNGSNQEIQTLLSERETDLINNNLVAINSNLEEILIEVLSEGNDSYKNIEDVPKTRLNEAMELFKQQKSHYIISPDTVVDFWNQLIFHLKKRENDFIEFQNLPENQDKTIRQLKEIFDAENPMILDELAVLWNRILEKVGLEFDIENAKSPIQLTENLKAYIKHKGSGEKINYNQLSTGIQHFIFKLGHIYSLYFNREIARGFLLVDEPENYLFPDFLYGLIDLYLDIIQNTQFIAATHSPIIAAQFEPYERIILEFDETGNVVAKKGQTPVGDDPNDILVKDFGVQSLLGKEGVKNWERYVELKVLIRQEQDVAKKKEMMIEFMDIGNRYNFGA